MRLLRVLVDRSWPSLLTSGLLTAVAGLRVCDCDLSGEEQSARLVRRLAPAAAYRGDPMFPRLDETMGQWRTINERERQEKQAVLWNRVSLADAAALSD